MNKERLLKLADHLESGKLGHEIFNFTVLNIGDYNKVGCGTVGCAIGELPILFPKEWEFRKDDSNRYFPVLKDSNEAPIILTWIHVDRFFDITAQESAGLFTPDSDEEISSLLELLPYNATRIDVAKQIREFVKLKEQNIESI